MGTLIAIMIFGAIWAIAAKLKAYVENRSKKKEIHFGLLRCPLCTKALPDESLKLTRGASGKLFLSNFCRTCFMKPKRPVSPGLLEDLARRGMVDPALERPSVLRRLLRRSGNSEATKVEAKTASKEMKAYLRQFKRDLKIQPGRLCWVLESELNEPDSEQSQ